MLDNSLKSLILQKKNCTWFFRFIFKWKALNHFILMYTMKAMRNLILKAVIESLLKIKFGVHFSIQYSIFKKITKCL